MKHKRRNLLELHKSMQANREVCSMVYHGDWLVRERIECLIDMGIDYQNQHEPVEAIKAIRCGIELLGIPEHCIDLMVKACGPDTYFITVTFRHEYPDQVLIKKTRLLVQLVNEFLFGRFWKKKGVSLQIQGVLEQHNAKGGSVNPHWHFVINTPASHSRTEAEVVAAFNKALSSKQLKDDHGKPYFDHVLSDRDDSYTDEHWCNYICKNLLHGEVLEAHDQWGAGYYQFKQDDLIRINSAPRGRLVAMPVRQDVEVDPMERKLQLLNQEVFIATRMPWVIDNPYSKHSDVFLYLGQPDLQ